MDNLADRSWIFNSVAKEATLKLLCQKVEAYFDFPRTRVCRYFADADDRYFVDWHGPHFRGFHAPFSVRPRLPYYLVECFFHPHSATKAFDHVIYIRHSTCDDPTGLVMTYAHELQHVVQQTTMPRLLEVNQILKQHLKEFAPNAVAIDVPHERQANIVSKLVAEEICGAEAVRKFADEQIKFMQNEGDYEQKARWIFFRDVASSTPYDLLKHTLPLVEKYKQKIDFGIDVSKPEWWVGPLKKCSQRKQYVTG